VPAEEVDRFECEYVWLLALAKQQGRHFRKLKQEFDSAGIKRTTWKEFTWTSGANGDSHALSLSATRSLAQQRAIAQCPIDFVG
jgi:hypothetical protein